MSRAPRGKFLGPAKPGAAYIDLFCATGRAKVRGTDEWIDGSAVAAWKMSVKGGSKFTQVIISDANVVSRAACADRLRALNAPVIELPGNALEAAKAVSGVVKPSGLHFALVDPYSLGALDFEIIRSLSRIKRIDLMMHVSAMDLQRNLDMNPQLIDAFAPGWRDHVDMSASKQQLRASIVEYWRNKVGALGTLPAPNMKLLTGSRISGYIGYWWLPGIRWRKIFGTRLRISESKEICFNERASHPKCVRSVFCQFWPC